jgi:hypothetical protein
MDETFNLIGKITAFGGSSVALAFGLFIWLGKKVLTGWFDKNLEAYKHQQNKELELLKHKINSLFNRITKIHEKEFEILSTAWKKLQDALGYIASISSPIQRSYNLDHMEEQQFNEFLEKSSLPNYQKEQLRREDNKTAYYKEQIFWHELNRAEKSLDDFHNYLLYNKIFFDSDLFNQFQKMDDLLKHTLISTGIGKESKDHKFISDAYNEIEKKSGPIANEIEKLVQKRLHYMEA